MTTKKPAARKPAAKKTAEPSVQVEAETEAPEDAAPAERGERVTLEPRMDPADSNWRSKG